MSAQGVARASRRSISPLRARNTSAFTRRDLAPEHPRHLRMGEVRRLGEQKRSPLLLGKLTQVAEQLAQLGAALDLLGEPLGRELLELGGLLAARSQERKAAVAGDRVEPRLERDLALAAALQVVEGRGEGVLDRVLSLLARAEHVTAETEDAGAVPLEDDLEGKLVPAADLLHEPFVARKGEQPLERTQRCAAW